MTDRVPDRSLDWGAYVGALARARVAAATARVTTREVTAEMQETAAALLAELWAAGERHGVSPEVWSWVTDLPGAALNVVTWRALRSGVDGGAER